LHAKFKNIIQGNIPILLNYPKYFAWKWLNLIVFTVINYYWHIVITRNYMPYCDY